MSEHYAQKLKRLERERERVYFTITNTRIIHNKNKAKAFHPFGVGKPSTGLVGWGYGGTRSLVSDSR